MDSTGAAAGDDQGSGWFEVKKKHRSSSKFSIQNWVGGFSKQQTNGKGVISNDRHRSHVSRPGKDFVQRGGAVHLSSSKEKEKEKAKGKEKEKDEHFLDKRVVDDDNRHVEAPPLKIIEIEDSNLANMSHGNASDKKPDVIIKIKWGDLEDDDLSPDCGSSSVSEIRFGKIADDDLAMLGPSRNVCSAGASNSSQDDVVVNKGVVEFLDSASDVCHEGSSPLEGGLEDNCKEVGEVASNGIIVGTESNVQNQEKSVINDTEPQILIDEPPCPSIEESAKAVEVPLLAPTPQDGDVESSSVRVDDGDARAVIGTQVSELASVDKDMPEASEISNTVSTVDDLRASPNTTSTSNALNAPTTSALGEPEEGESKERFRERLWCFLFENLNRAVDELYLLCELECDLVQVKEAILVLQEAELDFKELHIRVQGFDRLKKNPSHLGAGAVMSLKADQRRPHALSWEVRRMTTSPHRAEILSSSLEAFKKIQEERARARATGDVSNLGSQRHSRLPVNNNDSNRSLNCNSSQLETKSRRQNDVPDGVPVNRIRDRRSIELGRSGKPNLLHNNHGSPSTSASDPSANRLPPKSNSVSFQGGKGKKEQSKPAAEVEKPCNSGEVLRRHGASSDKEKEKEKRNSMPWKPADAWKEKRNWEEILASPCRLSSRVSHSPCLSRRSAERARVLHDKLMSPEKKKKTVLDLKREAEEKHARAMRIRSELENERAQKLQRTSEKLNRVNEWHAVRSLKLREGMYARHQRSESRHEAHIAQVVKRAGDESIKVNEVRFITSLNEENKKFLLRQKLHDSEMRRAEKILVMKSKQKEDMAREEAVMERRKLLEAEKLQRLAEIQRRKEEAQLRREEERKASSAAREARALEQLRRKEERVKAQQEEAELLAQRLAERLSESEQRRKVYLEQIRERASMDFRDQSSPFMRRSVNKDGQGRSTPPGNIDDSQANNSPGIGDSVPANNNVGMQQSLKRRIKKIRQRLMTLKHEVPENLAAENIGIGYRTTIATARAKIGRWLQDLQRHRQERKEGAASIGLIAAEMIKFLEGKELELQACRQAGLLDFISSALPASHISKPEACQVTIYLLRLLKVVLSVPANRTYFLAQNLLPPLIPMLAAALESYIKIAASLNVPGNNSKPSKTSSVNFDSISEVLEGFLWTVSIIIGHASSDERQLQMQDGLLELVVSYQIIHRLRDLFALHDRPQVEGTPFPSSILLSIKLLVVLTSKRSNVSSIDWECFPLPHKDGAEVSGLVENCNSDLATVSGVEDSKQGGESLKANGSAVSSVEGEKEKGNTPIELNSNEMGTKDEHLGSQKDLALSIPKSNVSQKDEKNSAEDVETGRKDEDHVNLKQPYAFLLSAISETGLVSLPSLLTAVLLQANNRFSSEQGSYVLPSNFEEVATGVLKVMNNLALLNITFMQKMLARPDLKMEFFHIMSFLLTHCTNSWKVATDQVGLLLLESLLLLGYFSLFHQGNQAVLRWGNIPTILHKVCDLPFAFFSDPELMPILAGTLVAACFGCEQNKGVVQQELSTEMILSLVKSCRNTSSSFHSRSPICMENSTDTIEPRKLQSEPKPTRSTARNSRVSVTKAGALGSSQRIGSIRNGKPSKISEGVSSKQRMAASSEEASTATITLYSRFSGSFMDRAEQFFSSEPSNEAAHG